MAIQFDELDDYYVITDDASLTLQDGDWCIGIWVYVTDNAGSDAQYLYNTNAVAATNICYLCLNEVGAGNPNHWEVGVRDGDGTSVAFLDASAPGADSKWRLIIFQRNTGAAAGHEIELWFCEVGAAAVKENDDSDANLAATNGGDWNIGRRTDGNADRYYGGIACEFFILPDRALTEAEITALGTGLRPHDLGYVSSVYLEMFTADATLRDMFGSNDAARQSVPTSVHHQPVMRTPRAVAFNDPPSLY